MNNSEKKTQQRKPKNPHLVIDGTPSPESLGRLCGAIRDQALSLFDIDPNLQKEVAAEASALREQLLKDPENPLECVMVDQVVCSWLETGASAYRKALLPECDKGRRLAPFLERQHHQSQARLIRSVETLSRLRSLKVFPVETDVLRIVVERADANELL